MRPVEATKDCARSGRRRTWPEYLQPIHERLVSVYEEVLPTYDNVIEAAGSRDPDQVREVAGQSLPRIERFNDV